MGSKLTEHQKGGFNEFNCLYDQEWLSLISGNLRTYGITEDQLSDLLVLIRACCNYEQDKRPRFDKIMEIMIGQQFEQVWSLDNNIHPLKDEPYRSSFFFFNKPDPAELNETVSDKTMLTYRHVTVSHKTIMV